MNHFIYVDMERKKELKDFRKITETAVSNIINIGQSQRNRYIVYKLVWTIWNIYLV